MSFSKKTKKHITNVLFLITIVFFVFSCWLMIALLSFHHCDPSWSHTGWNESVYNLCGVIGAYLADIFFFLFGMISYIIPILMIGSCCFLWKNWIKNQSINYFALFLNFTGKLALIVSSCGLVATIESKKNIALGGIIGNILNIALRPMMNDHLWKTLLLCIFVLGIVFFFSLSYSIILYEIEKILDNSLTMLNRVNIAFSRKKIKHKKRCNMYIYKKYEKNKVINWFYEICRSIFFKKRSKINQNKKKSSYFLTKPKIRIFDLKKTKDPMKDNRINYPNSSFRSYTDIKKNLPFINIKIRSDSELYNLPLTKKPFNEKHLDTISEDNEKTKKFVKNVLNTVFSRNKFHSRNTLVSHENNIKNVEIKKYSWFFPNERLFRIKEDKNKTKFYHDIFSESSIDITLQNKKNRKDYYRRNKISNSSMNDFKIKEQKYYYPELKCRYFNPVNISVPFIAAKSINKEAIQIQQSKITEKKFVSLKNKIHVDNTLQNENRFLAKNNFYYRRKLMQKKVLSQQIFIPNITSPKSSTFTCSISTHKLSLNRKSSKCKNHDLSIFPKLENNSFQQQYYVPLLKNKNNLSSFNKKISIFPSLDLLIKPPIEEKKENNLELKEMARLIETCLLNFRIKAKVVNYSLGPVITRFELNLAPGIKVSRISNLSRDLARSLSKLSIRIVETIPDKPYVGLEIPNKKRQVVYLRDVLDNPIFLENPSPLTMALGKNITGEPVIVDLSQMPHLLVAGTTGSGKSVGINAMILSILYKALPEDVRFIMIDPKMLELSIYEGIPHLLTKVVTDVKDATNALCWAVKEMENRYLIMSKLGVRNLTSYNEKIQELEDIDDTLLNFPGDLEKDEKDKFLKKLPNIVILIDEFSDLIMTVGKKIEVLITRLTQKSRAAGIYLILSTQRPSVDVITGLIKANIPTRISFAVSSKIDSRTILDQGGAESLLGMGDMLYSSSNSSILTRVHGAFVQDQEIIAVVQSWKKIGNPKYIDDITKNQEDNTKNENQDIEKIDPLFDLAVNFVISQRKISISRIQRHLRIGYNRAVRIIEQMEAQGIIGAQTDNSNRKILLSFNNIKY